MKRVVLVELHMDENANAQSVLESVNRFAEAQKDDKVVVTQQDHENLKAIRCTRKIHETVIA